MGPPRTSLRKRELSAFTCWEKTELDIRMISNSSGLHPVDDLKIAPLEMQAIGDHEFHLDLSASAIMASHSVSSGAIGSSHKAWRPAWAAASA